MPSNIQCICIVGAGFRGLGVLERIFAYAKQNKSSERIRVHLVDPSTEGPEQYDIRQPDYLSLNIVCGQTSIFPEAVSVPGCPPTTGPSFHKWVCDRGLRLAEDGFTVGTEGRTIEYGDFLPRRLLGEYLLWFREVIKNEATLFIDIVEHKGKAIDINSTDDGFAIHLSNTEIINANFLFITVGHIPWPNSKPLQERIRHRNIDQPYPLPERLDLIRSEEKIGISGLGLTAIDAILTLTIGRGGKIVTNNGIEEYKPSGAEPTIFAFSRSGLPYRSRPSLGIPLNYDPVVFTRASIDALRKKAGSRLDYDRDVLPIILTELRVAYHRAIWIRDFGWDKAQDLLNSLRKSVIKGNLGTVLTELDAATSFLFDPKSIYLESWPDPFETDLSVNVSAEAYEKWIYKWFEDDLIESRKGTPLSPLKAALEICREFREIIRYAVDFGGLTNESSERFFSFHSQTLNRIGVGPQKEHTAIILALMRAKILNITLGPSPKLKWDKSVNHWKLSSSLFQVQNNVFVDWIYRGSLNNIHDINNDFSIVGSMARKGFLRRFKPRSSVIQAVEIDRSFHPISQNGLPNGRIWVMGILCEGVTFYNGYVTSPDKFIRSQYDSDRAVSEIFSQIT